jgi:glyoxylase-like metal-dependent hydrolase (beta-lactamase superfamily II)
MTYHGTNTYLLGEKQVAVIDPGPNDDAHLSAILAAVPEGGTITHIFVTHAHYDHSELAMHLSKTVGATIYAFGDHEAGKSALMKSLSEQGGLGGGEGIDRAFEPDHTLSHMQNVTCDEWCITAHHTPGHMANHMCFQVGKILFTADHVMDWATSMVSPPDGDVGDFMRSCEHLLDFDWDLFLPGHGDIVRAPNERLRWLLSHRREREVQILTQLQAGPATPHELAKAIYTDIDAKLIPVAARNVFAHLLELHNKGLISVEKPIAFDGIFASLC